jgi:hypothetical protein
LIPHFQAKKAKILALMKTTNPAPYKNKDGSQCHLMDNAKMRFPARQQKDVIHVVRDSEFPGRDGFATYGTTATNSNFENVVISSQI